MNVFRWSQVFPFVMALSLWAQPESLGPSSGLVNIDGIVFSSRTGKTYVVDPEHGGVAVVMAGSVTKELKTGAGAVSIGVNERSGKVYVANSGDNSVAVVDGDKDQRIATVHTA